jgi:hypothetical protein
LRWISLRVVGQYAFFMPLQRWIMPLDVGAKHHSGRQSGLCCAIKDASTLPVKNRMRRLPFEKASPGTACVPKALLACEGKAGERSETDEGYYKTLIRLRAPSPVEKVKDFCNLAGSFVFSFPLGKLASAARLMRGTTRPSSALRAPSPLEKLKDFCNLAGSLPKAPQPSQEKLSFSGAACAFQAATP